MNVSISRRVSANWGMANVSSAVRQAGNIFYLLVLFYVEENRYQEKFSMSIPNVVVGIRCPRKATYLNEVLSWDPGLLPGSSSVPPLVAPGTPSYRACW